MIEGDILIAKKSYYHNGYQIVTINIGKKYTIHSIYSNRIEIIDDINNKIDFFNLTKHKYQPILFDYSIKRVL